MCARSVGAKGGQPLGVLPVAGIFGANGSGKSNVLEAMDDMRFYVVNSFRRTGDGLPRWPFRLDPGFESRPSSYEIDIVLGGVRHDTVSCSTARDPRGVGYPIPAREGSEALQSRA